MAPCCLFRLLVVRNTKYNYKHTSFGRLIEQCMVDRRRFYVMLVISPPENDSFRKDLCFIYLLQREISEMHGPTGVKFCTMFSTRPNFIMPVQNFGGAPPKNFRGQKHAKFGPISDDFEVRQRISPKQMKIFKIGFLFRLSRFLLR